MTDILPTRHERTTFLAYVSDCVSYDDDGYALYADDLADEVGEAFGLKRSAAHEALDAAISALEGGMDARLNFLRGTR